LLDGGTFSEEDLNAIDASNRQKIDEAVAFAETSPLPHPDELLTQVYVAERGGGAE
jgi:pyruvate dehydrogenase E1 component alpha subunit